MSELTKEQAKQEEEYLFPYHYLDVQSEYYRLVADVEHLNLLAMVKHRLGPFHGQSILDLGCGDGRLCYELKDEKVRVVGVDYSARAIAFARIFSPNVEFHVCDAADLHLDGQFDWVVMMETLEHIIPDAIPGVMKTVASLLREDGRLLVTVPSVLEPVSHKHFQHFTEATLTSAVAPYFKADRIEGFLRQGFDRGAMSAWRSAAYLAYPLRHRFAMARNVLAAFNRRSRESFLGAPDRCHHLVGTFTKQGQARAN